MVELLWFGKCSLKNQNLVLASQLRYAIQAAYSFLKCMLLMCTKGIIMPQIISTDSQRVAIRLNSADKTLLAKAAALSHTNITEFVLQQVLPKAREIVAQHEQLSSRDTAQILALLDNPPPANARLQQAMQDFAEQHRVA
jgi:putative ABC-type transporter